MRYLPAPSWNWSLVHLKISNTMWPVNTASISTQEKLTWQDHAMTSYEDFEINTNGCNSAKPLAIIRYQSGIIYTMAVYTIQQKELQYPQNITIQTPCITVLRGSTCTSYYCASGFGGGASWIHSGDLESSHAEYVLGVLPMRPWVGSTPCSGTSPYSRRRL